MVTLRSLQKKRGLRNNRSKRIRTQRLRGGRPNRESPGSLSRSYTASMRELENLPVVTATPRPSETPEERKKREEARAKARLNAKVMLNTTYEKLKGSIKNNRTKIWMETWNETIKYEEKNRKTLATDNKGSEDNFFKPGGIWRSKMDHIKEIREYWEFWFNIKDKNVPKKILDGLSTKILNKKSQSKRVYDKLFLGYFDDLLAEIEKLSKRGTSKRTHKKKKKTKGKKKKTKGKKKRYGGEPTLPNPFTYLKNRADNFRNCETLEHGEETDNNKLSTGTGSYGVFIVDVKYLDRTYYTLNTTGTQLKLSYKQIHKAYDLLIKILTDKRRQAFNMIEYTYKIIDNFLQILNNQKTYGKQITGAAEKASEGVGVIGGRPRAAPAEEGAGEVAEERKAIQWKRRNRNCYVRADDINCLCSVIYEINNLSIIYKSILSSIIDKLNEKRKKNDDERDLYDIIMRRPIPISRGFW